MDCPHLEEIVRTAMRFGRVLEASASWDEEWGCIYTLTFDLTASEALRANIELQRLFPGAYVVVKWTQTDVSEDDMAELLAEVAHVSGARARAPPGFDAVRDVSEGRDRSYDI
jgi:hypothetical protein